MSVSAAEMPESNSTTAARRCGESTSIFTLYLASNSCFVSRRGSSSYCGSVTFSGVAKVLTNSRGESNDDGRACARESEYGSVETGSAKNFLISGSRYGSSGHTSQRMNISLRVMRIRCNAASRYVLIFGVSNCANAANGATAVPMKNRETTNVFFIIQCELVTTVQCMQRFQCVSSCISPIYHLSPI